MMSLLALGCSPSNKPTADEIDWSHSLDKALALAKANHKPLFIHFTAQWCTPCKKLEADTYPDEAVSKLLRAFNPVKLDVGDGSEASQELMERYGVGGLPAVLFAHSDGRALASPRIGGFVEAPRMAGLITRALSDLNKQK